MKAVQKRNLVNGAAKMGKYIRQELEKAKGKIGDQIEDVRGKGLLLAFDTKPRIKSMDVHKQLKLNCVVTGIFA